MSQKDYKDNSKYKKSIHDQHSKSPAPSLNLKSTQDLYYQICRVPLKQIINQKKYSQNLDKTPNKSKRSQNLQYTYDYSNNSIIKDQTSMIKKSSYGYVKQNARNFAQQKQYELSSKRTMKETNRLVSQCDDDISSSSYKKKSMECTLLQQIQQKRVKERTIKKKDIIEVKVVDLIELIEKYERLRIDHEQVCNELSFMLQEIGENKENSVFKSLGL